MNKKISLIDKLFRGKKKESSCCSFEIEEVNEEKSSCSCDLNDKANTCCSKK